MAISIKHAFTSAKGDGTDATLVRPSNWNAAHTTSCATGVVLGRQTAGVGVFEELPLSAVVAAALAAVDGPSFLAALGVGGFRTGDTKFSIDGSAEAGWLVYNLSVASATIGDATSGATLSANAANSALFQLIWNNIADADAPVPGGRGANALADWNTHHQITLPWIPGRAIIGAAGGASLTTRVIGRMYGEENHLLTTGEMPAHTHANSLSDPTHGHTVNGGRSVSGDFNNNGGGGGSFSAMSNSTIAAQAASTGVTITNQSQGGGATHNNMQPSIALWARVKL